MKQHKRTIIEPHREIPVADAAEVLVVGGGPGGLASAIGRAAGSDAQGDRASGTPGIPPSPGRTSRSFD